MTDGTDSPDSAKGTEGGRITPEQQRLYQLLGEVVAHIGNEPVLLVNYERLQEDAFARIWNKEGKKEIQERLDAAALHLGGPPKLYLLRTDESPPPEDGFPGAALQEVLDVFHRARKSVIRAHMYWLGNRMATEQPAFFSSDPKMAKALLEVSNEAFWEHAETAYIRLASYWDRVGQVLNFAFFNIRSFKHEGFQSVMDRINDNFVKMDDRLKSSSAWKLLREFQCSSKEDGYKWLQERRNLLVHSLHLQPIPPDDDSRFPEGGSDSNTVFTSQFNHLDHAHREKLRPRDQEGEVSLLLNQLNMAAVRFKTFLRLIEAAPSKMRDRFWLARDQDER